MLNDVDETLKQYLIADVPIERGEVDVSFERPTREWSGRLSKPTLSLFMFDIRERSGFRDETAAKQRTAQGLIAQQLPPRRVDLSYMVTAWAREPEDEHRILGRVLGSLYRATEIPPRHFQGELRDSEYPLLGRVAPPDHIIKPADLWGVMDNELRTSLTWVVTAPLQVFAPVEGPLVRTVELGFGETGEESRERWIQVAGLVHRKGDPLAVMAGVRVSVVGTAHTAVTGTDGKFTFAGVLAGEHTLAIVTAEGEERTQSVFVPSASYDIEL
ncbi:MAG: DUF4255 domain-containing protein [Chloroflexi bacterium]|nr:DUF4255 domain-containing protein [Chloroflexota bacterium]PWB47708.1 MAG: hypothetical protein C3F10_02430 [Dehalococcoidia bacterium]